MISLPNDERTKEMALVWKMERKYIIRRRIAFAIALPLALIALAGFYYVATHIWWVDWETGYCFGSLDQCFPEYFGKE